MSNKNHPKPNKTGKYNGHVDNDLKNINNVVTNKEPADRKQKKAKKG